MNHSWDIVIWILVVFGLLFFGVVVFALYWAAKNRQFDQFEKASRVIFDEDEPEGVQLDHFPDKRKRKK